ISYSFRCFYPKPLGGDLLIPVPTKTSVCGSIDPPKEGSGLIHPKSALSDVFIRKPPAGDLSIPVPAQPKTRGSIDPPQEGFGLINPNQRLCYFFIFVAYRFQIP